MSEFNDRVAIVTGAASGIGRAAAETFANRGAKVVVSDVNEDGGNETVERIRGEGGDALFVRADISKPGDCEAMVDRTMEQFGRLDMACNNAGVSGALGATGDYDLDEWRKVIDINLSGQFYCMRYQIPAMLKGGGGAIVNVASILGQAGFAGAPAYVAAKHGLVGLTRASALEYGEAGIRVNAVGPGFISTPLIAAMEEDEETNQQLISLHPMGRLGRAQEVAELMVFLCSDKASYITGSYHPVDGGFLAR